jgi:hypothetical protein
MGKCSETVAANTGGEVNGIGSCQAHHVGISPEEDRSGTAGTVGEGEGGEEGGLEQTEPVASYAAVLRASSESLNDVH